MLENRYLVYLLPFSSEIGFWKWCYLSWVGLCTSYLLYHLLILLIILYIACIITRILQLLEFFRKFFMTFIKWVKLSLFPGLTLFSCCSYMMCMMLLTWEKEIDLMLLKMLLFVLICDDISRKKNYRNDVQW